MLSNESASLASKPSALSVAGQGQIAELWARQNPHSIFAAAAGLFFSATIITDVVLDRPGIDAVMLWVLFAFCVMFSGIAILMGEHFPLLAGLVCVIVFTAASVFFIGPWGDSQSAISSAQEVPILALYLGWFVPRPAGRILMVIMMALLAVSFALNRDFWSGGIYGIPTAAQTLLIALFCFEIGSMLWRKSEQKMTIDPLTGALNRGGLLQRLEREMSRHERRGHPLSLVVIDFDFFKELNDTQGHSAGDRALTETVSSWKEGVRSGDIVGRTGGDEFAILLRKTEDVEAQNIIQRLRDVSPHPWSWGIAQLQADDSVETLFARADSKLYADKRARA